MYWANEKQQNILIRQHELEENSVLVKTTAFSFSSQSQECYLLDRNDKFAQFPSNNFIIIIIEEEMWEMFFNEHNYYL